MPQNQNKQVPVKTAEKTGGNVGYVANIALRLLVICALVALLVAGVNAITKDKIALNARENTARALSEIYGGDGLHFAVAPTGYDILDEASEPIGTCADISPETRLADVSAVYEIRKQDAVYGYAVEVSPMGFKDNVDMLVAVNPDGSAKAVQIISLSETKGIGDKVTQSDFLDKFKNVSAGFSDNAATLSEIVIAGATRTSEPVTKAVDTALKQVDAVKNNPNMADAAHGTTEEEAK